MQMTSIADKFRELLSEELKSALAKRDKEDASTVRSIMSALDNAGALSKEEISRIADTSVTEVPRKKVSKQDIQNLLDSELRLRNDALADYQRLGNSNQVAINQKSIATIRKLAAVLAQL